MSSICRRIFFVQTRQPIQFHSFQMSNFTWDSCGESTFQGFLNKYTNAFKRYQNRYFVLDENSKSLLYFMPEDVRKRGFRGILELNNCCVLPSDEDDVTFSIQNIGPENFKLRARDAKERQKWIDKLRACSGTISADAYASSLPISKPQYHTQLSAASPPKENLPTAKSRRTPKSNTRQQTLRELNDVIHSVEINQREFVEIIEAIPEDASLNSLSKEMLLLCSISRSCINSLEDSLILLTKGKPSSNTRQKQLTRSLSNGIDDKTTNQLSSSPTSKTPQ